MQRLSKVQKSVLIEVLLKFLTEILQNKNFINLFI